MVEPIAESGVTILEQAVLSSVSTFQLGGPCRHLVTCETPDQLRSVLDSLSRSVEPFLLMGGGSNVLFSDHGVDATVVRFCTDHEEIRALTEDRVWASGSTRLDDLARRAAELGLGGLMCCTGIPGTVGGAIVGNAGAWGEQIGDCLSSVTLRCRDGRERVANPAELGFRYRHSNLKESGDVVLSAEFRLVPDDAAALAEQRRAILAERSARHPDLRVDPCIGSIFRNVEPTSSAGRRQAAGWFLDKAGAKAMCVGGARVFARHANIITRGEGCRAQDVRDLAAEMSGAVRAQFGLELVREVRYAGRFDGEEAHPEGSFF